MLLFNVNTNVETTTNTSRVLIYSLFLFSILSITIFVIMALAFFETPSSLSWSSDISKPAEYLRRYEFPCNVLETIDLFCILLFTVDAITKVIRTIFDIHDR